MLCEEMVGISRGIYRDICDENNKFLNENIVFNHTHGESLCMVVCARVHAVCVGICASLSL